MRKPLTLGLVIVGGSLAVAGLVVFVVWAVMGPSVISTHGLIAIGLGTFFTLVLGVGLMTLVFVSARSGHDDRV